MNNPTPPKFPLRLLSWFCHPSLHRYIEGDLLELYEGRVELMGKRKANFRLFIDVFLLFRPSIIRPMGGYYQLNQWGMFKNYFKVGSRNILRHKTFSFINILGLSLGMSVAMLIGIWILDELAYNKYHDNYDHIARVMQHQNMNGERQTKEAVPLPLAEELKSSYSEHFKRIILSSWYWDHTLAHGSTAVTKMGGYMGSETPHMLSLKMLKGTIGGLSTPRTILLSSSTATALFGSVNPLDKTITVDNDEQLLVTGVYEDLPRSSSFKDLKFIATWEHYASSAEWVKKASENPDWTNDSYQLYVQIEPHIGLKEINERIRNIKQDKLSTENKSFKSEVFLHPMSDWHLRSEWKNGIKTRRAMQYVWLYGIIGCIVLLIACINFTNLSTAWAEKRSKEVGVRKTIGSSRVQLVFQFLGESFLMVFAALFFALICVYVIVPYFNALSGKNMDVPWTNPLLWVFCFGFAVITGLMAGAYPALLLSSLQPIWTNKTYLGGNKSALRKTLVVFQFTVSIGLMISTWVVYNQVQYSQKRPLGYDNNRVIMMEVNSPVYHNTYTILREQLKSKGAIVEMAEASSPLTAIEHETFNVNWQGRDPDSKPSFNLVWVSHNYAQTIKWEVVKGRNFSDNYVADSLKVIINESAATFMGLKNPLGKQIEVWGTIYEIVGIIKDMMAESPFGRPAQTIYSLHPNEQLGWLVIRLNPNKSISTTLAIVESVFKKNMPNQTFNYVFADQEQSNKFLSIKRTAKFATLFATIAIIISCLGLFGLVAFITERRSKEIGIRKVLGANIFSVWKLITKEFALLILVSIIVASPIAYLLLNQWLERFEYRILIGWEVFVWSGVCALSIALLTIIYHTLRSININPVDVISNE